MDYNKIEYAAQTIPEVLYKWPYRSFIDLFYVYGHISHLLLPYSGAIYLGTNSTDAFLYFDKETTPTIRVFILGLFELSLDVRDHNLRPYISFGELLISLDLVQRD